MHAKPVGVRTLGLVGLGSALVTMAGSGFSAEGVDANASRAIQGIVTGIGFLGAGVIVKGARKSRVHGMTTAAAIWVTAALGISCGIGAYFPVAVGVILLLLLIGIGGRIDRIIDARWRRKHENDTEKAQASGQGTVPPD
jgi:putative Mg2+ transporter-C (MgtC) family protein